MFFIRADGNARIGAGHLMRCMAVVEELALLQGKENICFVCADSQSADLVKEYGFQSHVLGTDYRDMESELPLWRELVDRYAVSAESCYGADGHVLLVDSYYVTDRYLAELKQFGYTILMEDSGTRCYPVDCVINYNAPADLEAYKKLYHGRDVRLVIGSRYVPLRRQFVRLVDGQSSEENIGESVEYTIGRSAEESANILITTGGGDIENIAGKILEGIYTRDLTFHLVMGQFNPHFQEMIELGKQRPNIRIHHNVSDMAGLMRGCDIAVTAGGSTIYELSAVGVPFICFSYAENQELLTEYIGKNSIAGFAGAWHCAPEETLGNIKRMFEELVGSKEMRSSYSVREKAMIDGRGAERLARILAERSIS